MFDCKIDVITSKLCFKWKQKSIELLIDPRKEMMMIYAK